MVAKEDSTIGFGIPKTIEERQLQAREKEDLMTETVETPESLASDGATIVGGDEPCISFMVNLNEPPVLRLMSGGRIYSHGRLIAGDIELVAALRNLVELFQPDVQRVTSAMAQLSTEDRVKVIRAAIEFELWEKRNEIVQELATAEFDSLDAFVQIEYRK